MEYMIAISTQVLIIIWMPVLFVADVFLMAIEYLSPVRSPYSDFCALTISHGIFAAGLIIWVGPAAAAAVAEISEAIVAYSPACISCQIEVQPSIASLSYNAALCASICISCICMLVCQCCHCCLTLLLLLPRTAGAIVILACVLAACELDDEAP